MKDVLIINSSSLENGILRCDGYSIQPELPYEHPDEFVCLLSQDELSTAIRITEFQYQGILPEDIVFNPEARYHCFVEGTYYFPCGWSGYSNRFDLLSCYWLLKKYHPSWSFTQGKFIGREWKRPEVPAIESLKNDEYSYYLDKDIAAINQKCFQCGIPLWERYQTRTMHEVWFEWWRYGERVGLRSRRIEKIKEEAPEWLQYMQKVCSIHCFEKLQIRSGRLIKERIDKWINQTNELSRVKRLRKITLKARKSLKLRDRDALKLHKKEFEQEVTLPS